MFFSINVEAQDLFSINAMIFDKCQIENISLNSDVKLIFYPQQ